MVHGYMDTAATFIPLIRHLPDTYYYVSFDFPGHGKSDPIYSGPNISQTFMLEILRRVVKHMQWKTFVCLAHSMGIITALFYQHVYSGRIKKMINLDPMLPIAHYGPITYCFEEWYKSFYEYYYDNYHSIQATPKSMSYEKVVNFMMKARGLTREQAELVLSRSLVPAANV